MTAETTLDKWAKQEKQAWDWREKIKEDSKKIDLIRERKLLLNLFTNIIGLDENHAELFFSGDPKMKGGLRSEYRKTVREVLGWLEESKPYQLDKGYKQKSRKFFEGFTKAMKGFYTPDQVEEIRQMYTPGGELNLTTTLTGDRGFRFVHRATLQSLLSQ